MAFVFYLRLTLCFYLCLFSFETELKYPFTIETVESQSSNPTPLQSFLEIPSTPVVLNNEERACIEMCFGNKPQCFKLTIQSGSFYIWVTDSNGEMTSDNHFDVAKSRTAEKNRTEIYIEYEDDKSIVGYTVKDDYYIADEKIFRGDIIVATRSDSFTETEGMIGLGYTPSSYEERYSFIEQLYNEKIIFHKVFTQSFKTSTRGELTFGKIPDNIVSDYKHYGRCAALNMKEGGKIYKNKSWQCELTGVYYGEEYSQRKVKELYDTNVSFFSWRKRALVPLTFFDYLEESYFKEYISDGICERTVKQRYDTFICKQDMLNAKEFNLVFGNWVMRIPTDQLFKYNKKNEGYEFVFYHKKDFEKYSLGRPIVRNFHMVYDNQNSQIGFYSYDNVIYIGKDQPEPPKVYEYIPDKESSKTQKENESTKRPAITPEQMIKPFTENTNKAPTVKVKSRTVSNAFIVQIMLLVFVVIVVVALLGFVAYLYIRYRRKTHFPNAEYYIKQSNQFMETEFAIKESI